MVALLIDRVCLNIEAMAQETFKKRTRRDFSNFFFKDNKQIYGKVGLRRHIMTQITAYKPLEDEDSEYDARSCSKKRP